MTTVIKERPILFTAPMVRALLAGTKTQTRRIVKGVFKYQTPHLDWMDCIWEDGDPVSLEIKNNVDHLCPYGQPDDRLWVRETWGYTRQCDDINGPGDVIAYGAGGAHVYEDSSGARRLRHCISGAIMQPNHWYDRPRPWKPSIHMPRWASRITLEITDVRVQRLNDIGEEDARAEGPLPNSLLKDKPDGYRQAFRLLWESINGVGSWDANPWVWAMTFKQIAP